MKKIFFSLFLLLIALPVSAQPRIRVGLYSTDDWVEATANDSYKIKANGTVLKEVAAGEITKIKYKKDQGEYVIKQGADKYVVGTYVRLVPMHKNKVVIITNYENRPEWNEELNDNEFKGKLEVHYAESTDTTWAIEIVGLENYVKGVAEAGNDNDADYLKALYTAARTYAYWHYTYPTKHDEENYLLGVTANDQVYRGYNFTERAPNISQAVDDTKGMIVTYDDEVAVTPYFSNSDGRTRSWSEVWAGNYAYLISVDDPGCEGMTLTGHGVGLSTYGARYFAEQDWGWKKILKYYYTGVEIQQLYF